MKLWPWKKSGKVPPETVSYVDLERYTGVWYEIARYPNRFQTGCVGSMATYTLRKEGDIDVLNQCYNRTFSGKIRKARGRAWVVDRQSNAKLKVSFFRPFSGDYWIIELGEDYSYAVIGHPKRKYLWILNRKKTMADELYKDLLARIERQGYDTDKIIKTKQPTEGDAS